MFENPIAPKMKKASKTFAAPSKEAATTGAFMAAGDYYGTGFRQKMGSVRGEGKSNVPMKSKRADAPKSLA